MSDTASPYHAPSAPLASSASANALEVTWPRAIKVWWSVLWRTLLFSMAIGAVLGAIIGFMLGALGYATSVIVVISQLVGALIGIPVAIAVMRHALRMSWSDFRIVLVAPQR